MKEPLVEPAGRGEGPARCGGGTSAEDWGGGQWRVAVGSLHLDPSGRAARACRCRSLPSAGTGARRAAPAAAARRSCGSTQGAALPASGGRGGRAGRDGRGGTGEGRGGRARRAWAEGAPSRRGGRVASRPHAAPGRGGTSFAGVCGTARAPDRRQSIRQSTLCRLSCSRAHGGAGHDCYARKHGSPPRASLPLKT